MKNLSKVIDEINNGYVACYPRRFLESIIADCEEDVIANRELIRLLKEQMERLK